MPFEWQTDPKPAPNAQKNTDSPFSLRVVESTDPCRKTYEEGVSFMAVSLSVVMEIPGKEPREFDYEFEQDQITFGRDEDNDIQIPLATVSRNHLTLQKEGREWFLKDLNSTHGTTHNGQIVGKGAKKLLRSGDVLEIVHFKITFQLADSTSLEFSKEETEARNRRLVEEVLATLGSDEMPFLRVMNGPDEGRKFELGPDITEAVMGRGADCDFQINDANISRQHAKVKRDWTEITIEDMGSKNGVCIGEQQILQPTPIRDADEIMLGAVRLTFIDPSAKFLGKLDDIPAFAQATSAMDAADIPDSDLQSTPDAPVSPPVEEQEPVGPIDGESESDDFAADEDSAIAPQTPDSTPEETEEPEPDEGIASTDDAASPKRRTFAAADVMMIFGVLLFAILGAVVLYILLLDPET
jgi:pSer/pThr/pTyr-binding forkhead associated (FHA) protein